MMLDLRGLECPEPKIRTLKALPSMGSDGLTLLVDSAGARESIRSLLDVHGYRYTIEQREDHWAIVFLNKEEKESGHE